MTGPLPADLLDAVLEDAHMILDEVFDPAWCGCEDCAVEVAEMEVAR